MPMSLKQAKLIAGRVGARIEETTYKDHEDAMQADASYTITIAGRPIRYPVTGVPSKMTFEESTPFQAAHTALVQTGIHAIALQALAKRIYVEEDLLFASEDKQP